MFPQSKCYKLQNVILYVLGMITGVHNAGVFREAIWRSQTQTLSQRRVPVFVHHY